jgi:hypothetical protein
MSKQGGADGRMKVGLTEEAFQHLVVPYTFQDRLIQAKAYKRDEGLAHLIAQGAGRRLVRARRRCGGLRPYKLSLHHRHELGELLGSRYGRLALAGMLVTLRAHSARKAMLTKEELRRVAVRLGR